MDDRMIMLPCVLMKKTKNWCYLAAGPLSLCISLYPWWGVKPRVSALEGARTRPSVCWSVYPPSTLHGRLNLLHPLRPHVLQIASRSLPRELVCPVCVLLVFPVYFLCCCSFLSDSLPLPHVSLHVGSFSPFSWAYPLPLWRCSASEKEGSFSRTQKRPHNFVVRNATLMHKVNSWTALLVWIWVNCARF